MADILQFPRREKPKDDQAENLSMMHMMSGKRTVPMFLPNGHVVFLLYDAEMDVQSFDSSSLAVNGNGRLTHVFTCSPTSYNALVARHPKCTTFEGIIETNDEILDKILHTITPRGRSSFTNYRKMNQVSLNRILNAVKIDVDIKDAPNHVYPEYKLLVTTATLNNSEVCSHSYELPPEMEAQARESVMNQAIVNIQAMESHRLDMNLMVLDDIIFNKAKLENDWLLHALANDANVIYYDDYAIVETACLSIEPIRITSLGIVAPRVEVFCRNTVVQAKAILDTYMVRGFN